MASPGSPEKFHGTMQAWQYSNVSNGLEKSIELKQDAIRPSTTNLSKSQILVQVLAMSPNPVDYKLAELGLPVKMFIKKPASPGQDFCGKVAATHPSNDSLKVGQLVFGTIGVGKQYGTLAQFSITDVSNVTALPEGVKVEDAATVGTTGLTAYQCVVPHVQEKPYTPKVFINGGSGGTGTFGIQFAKVFGAQVVASCSTPNVELCKSLGADEVIDYKTQDVVETLKKQGQVFDLVVDNVGSSPANLYAESEHFLKPTGKYVQVGGGLSMSDLSVTASRMLKPSFLGGGKRPFQFLGMKPDANQLAVIGGWMKEGKVKAVIDKTLEFQQGNQAYELLKGGRTRGNIVVKVPEETS